MINHWHIQATVYKCSDWTETHVVSAVRICEQYPLTASASEERSPQSPYRGFAHGTHWGTSVFRSPHIKKIPWAAVLSESNFQRAINGRTAQDERSLTSC